MESGYAIREAQGARDSFKRGLSDIQKFSSLFSVLFLSFFSFAPARKSRATALVLIGCITLVRMW